MNSQRDTPPTVSIFCPTCGTLLHPDLAEQRSQVRCPDCYVAVPVPSLSEVLKRQAQQRPPKIEDVGTYRIQSDDTDDSAKSEQTEQSIAPYIHVDCRICASRLHPEVREQAYQVRCPDCHEPVDVPALKDVPRQPRRKRAPKKIGTYNTNAPIAPPTPQTHYLEVQAEIRREAIEPPPRWTFFSGVFSLPWRPGVLPRWGFLSLGFTAIAMLAAILTMLIGGGSSFGILGGAFLALPATWITLWTCSYAAACCLPVVTDTAAGMDRIASWPEAVFNEWMAQLFYVAYVAGEAAALGYGLGLVADWLGGPGWMVWTATAFLLYPVIQLSALEADSFLTPVTRPILRTLLSCWWGWLTFYAMSAILISLLIALTVAGWQWSPLLAACALGPCIAATVLIIARLLGRLAWRASPLSADKVKKS